MELTVIGATVHVEPGRTRHGDLHVRGRIISGDVSHGDTTTAIGDGCSVVPLLVDTDGVLHHAAFVLRR